MNRVRARRPNKRLKLTRPVALVVELAFVNLKACAAA